MPFSAATVVTNVGKGIAARRQIGSTPAQAEPKYVGIGVGATGAARTAAAADTGLSTAVESRVSGTSSSATQDYTDDTYQVVGTVTASAGRSVDEAGTFDASSGGNMDVSATFAVVSLNSGDSIQLTFRKKFA